ncbi:hypothetical protein C8Q73DRAFT_793077 [Cubamyces lactineus]|nr:hypothetical protein C8Q73DRAFT_793077 [Cubamyces lactineus]
MERKPSKTYQRIRKLSDSIIPLELAGSTMERKPSKTYQRIRKLSDSIIHAFRPAAPSRPWTARSGRRVSTHDVGGPSPHELLSPIAWLRPDNSYMLPIGKELRPRAEQPPVRDPNAPRRPERPRDLEDLPYGAKGCVRLSDAPWLRVDSPGPSRATNPNSIPFPTAPKTHEKAREPTFSPFATIGRDSSSRAPPKTVATPSSPRMDKGKGKARETEGTRREDHRPEDPATVRRQGAIRRTSRTSDAALPPSPLQSRSVRHDHGHKRGIEDPAVGLQRSRSMATPRAPKHSSVAPSKPFNTPVSTRPNLRAYPHDEDLQSQRQLPRLFSGASRSTEGSGSDGPLQMPHAPVVTPRRLAQEKANMPLHYPPKPRTVKVSAPERVASFEAKVVRPRQPPREPVPASSSHSREPTRVPPSLSSKAKDLPKVASSSTKPSASVAATRPAVNKVREHEREQSKSHTRQTTGRTVEHYPMTYFYEEVKRDLGALQLDVGMSCPPMPSGAHNPAQYGAQGQAPATAPLRPRRKEREEQGAPRVRPEGSRQSRK